MRCCTLCLYPANHPLTITFDQDGVCSGCKVHEEKDTFDWSVRAKKLQSILDGYRNSSGRNYDCIIPVSGARDSYFIVHWIKNVCGMNPLLVSYNKHYNTDVGIRNLANLRIVFDCDILVQTVAPKVVKKITRATLRRVGSIYWHCIAGQTVFPVQVAVRFKIPLIVWGVHQGIDQVGMFSHADEVEMSRKYRKEHDLMGYEAEDLVDSFDDLSEDDLRPFMYPHDAQLERVGVRGIYLNNYLRWDSKAQHEEMIRLYGYESYRQTRTFDTYNDVDCFNYSDIHDYIKYLKYGYGKALDHACREIRLRRMSRSEGVSIVESYKVTAPRNTKLFLDWIGMKENAFNFILDQHRNPALWQRDDAWNWIFTGSSPRSASQDPGAELNSTKDRCSFIVTDSKRPSYSEDRYVLFGKGYYE